VPHHPTHQPTRHSGGQRAHRAPRRRARAALVAAIALGLLIPSGALAARAWDPIGSPRTAAAQLPHPHGVPTGLPSAELSRIGAELKVKRGTTFQPSRRAKRCVLPEPRTITVVSYNIHFAISRNGSVQLGRIADELRAWDADVVALQEIDDTRSRSGYVDQAEWLAGELGMTATFAAAEEHGDGSYGNAVLSRFPVVSSESFRLPAVGSGLTNPRVLLRTVIDVRGFELAIDSTHFSNTSDASDNLQARRTVELATEPRIVMGDLNSSPHDPAYSILRSGLVDAWELVGIGKGRTYPTWNPVGRIDYALYAGELRPVSADVLPSSVSDHSALRTRFELQPPCRPAGAATTTAKTHT